jgi:hypothetical protein
MNQLHAQMVADNLKKAKANSMQTALNSGYSQEAALRQKAREQAQGMAGASADMASQLASARIDAMGGMADATTAGRNDLRVGGAKAMAALQGGGASGGGLFAAAQQTGLEGGNAQSKFEGEMAMRRGQLDMETSAAVGEANKAAAADAYGATEIQRKIGAEAGNTAKAMADFNSFTSDATAKRKHWYGDDAEGLAADLESYANTVTDPAVREAAMAEAMKIRGGYDF